MFHILCSLFKVDMVNSFCMISVVNSFCTLSVVTSFCHVFYNVVFIIFFKFTLSTFCIVNIFFIL